MMMFNLLGGVGMAATQLAKLVDGVTIYGTTSQQKTENALSNGVNNVLHYDNYKEQLKEICPDGLDLIIDNQAADNFTVTMEFLKTFGRMILIGKTIELCLFGIKLLLLFYFLRC